MTVWVVKATEGVGYVRELVDGAPIVTTWPHEAERYESASAAGAVVAQIRRLGDRVPHVAVLLEVDGERRFHGEP